MKQENNYEYSRQECLLLKAKIVSCMTQKVKLKIGEMGYTPTDIATIYILTKFNLSNHTHLATNSTNLALDPLNILLDDRFIVFNKSGTQIIDVILDFY